VIDSQSVRAAPTVPRTSRGWDNAKKVNGRKRHIAVDAGGLLLEVLATPASAQDRDAARPLLWNLHRSRRRVRLAWADGGYAGQLARWAGRRLNLTVEIVKRPDDLHVPGLAAPLGGGAHPGLDHRLPALRPRLRTPPGTSRSHRPLGNDHPHDPPPRPPRLRFRNRHLKIFNS
jgi:Transposase DDE domain